MLVNKKHPKQCGLCAWADKITDEDMLCYHRGPVQQSSKCFRFRYDPFKRVPSRMPLIKKAPLAPLEEEDANGC
jgi:hypothetical protein